MKLFIFIVFALISSTLLAFDFKAKSDCAYGTYGCNACVPDVASSFEHKSSGSRKMREDYHIKIVKRKALNDQRPDRINIIYDHVQGLARLSGIDRDNWAIFTRSSRHKGESGIFLVRFDAIVSKGDSWKNSTRKSDRTSSYLYYPADKEISHAGGVSTLGGMAFVAGECSSDKDCLGRVDIYDARDPFKMTLINRLVLDGSQGELTDDEGQRVVSKAAAVAATQLEDGRLLLFIGGSQSSRSGWLFVSDSSNMTAETKWIFLDYWHSKELKKGDPWYGWENVNFVQECHSGDIYLSTMGTLQNRHHLYKMSYQNNQMNMDFIYGRRLNTGVLANLRNGGGVHVTPAGKMVSYAIGRFGYTLEEFSSR